MTLEEQYLELKKIYLELKENFIFLMYAMRVKII